MASAMIIAIVIDMYCTFKQSGIGVRTARNWG